MSTNKDLWKIKLINEGSNYGVIIANTAGIEQIMQDIAPTPSDSPITACPNCSSPFADITVSCQCGLFVKK